MSSSAWWSVVLLLMVEYSVLSLLYLLSYFKLFVTLVKYIPQVCAWVTPGPQLFS